MRSSSDASSIPFKTKLLRPRIFERIMLDRPSVWETLLVKLNHFPGMDTLHPDVLALIRVCLQAPLTHSPATTITTTTAHANDNNTDDVAEGDDSEEDNTWSAESSMYEIVAHMRKLAHSERFLINAMKKEETGEYYEGMGVDQLLAEGNNDPSGGHNRDPIHIVMDSMRFEDIGMYTHERLHQHWNPVLHIAGDAMHICIEQHGLIPVHVPHYFVLCMRINAILFLSSHLDKWLSSSLSPSSSSEQQSAPHHQQQPQNGKRRDLLDPAVGIVQSMVDALRELWLAHYPLVLHTESLCAHSTSESTFFSFFTDADNFVIRSFYENGKWILSTPRTTTPHDEKYMKETRSYVKDMTNIEEIEQFFRENPVERFGVDQQTLDVVCDEFETVVEQLEQFTMDIITSSKSENAACEAEAEFTREFVNNELRHYVPCHIVVTEQQQQARNGGQQSKMPSSNNGNIPFKQCHRLQHALPHVSQDKQAIASSSGKLVARAIEIEKGVYVPSPMGSSILYAALSKINKCYDLMGVLDKHAREKELEYKKLDRMLKIHELYVPELVTSKPSVRTRTIDESNQVEAATSRRKRKRKPQHEEESIESLREEDARAHNFIEQSKRGVLRAKSEAKRTRHVVYQLYKVIMDHIPLLSYMLNTFHLADETIRMKDGGKHYDIVLYPRPNRFFDADSTPDVMHALASIGILSNPKKKGNGIDYFITKIFPRTCKTRRIGDMISKFYEALPENKRFIDSIVEVSMFGMYPHADHTAYKSISELVGLYTFLYIQKPSSVTTGIPKQRQQQQQQYHHNSSSLLLSIAPYTNDENRTLLFSSLSNNDTVIRSIFREYLLHLFRYATPARSYLSKHLWTDKPFISWHHFKKSVITNANMIREFFHRTGMICPEGSALATKANNEDLVLHSSPHRALVPAGRKRGRPRKAAPSDDGTSKQQPQSSVPTVDGATPKDVVHKETRESSLAAVNEISDASKVMLQQQQHKKQQQRKSSSKQRNKLQYHGEQSQETRRFIAVEWQRYIDERRTRLKDEDVAIDAFIAEIRRDEKLARRTIGVKGTRKTKLKKDKMDGSWIVCEKYRIYSLPYVEAMRSALCDIYVDKHIPSRGGERNGESFDDGGCIPSLNIDKCFEGFLKLPPAHIMEKIQSYEKLGSLSSDCFSEYKNIFDWLEAECGLSAHSKKIMYDSFFAHHQDRKSPKQIQEILSKLSEDDYILVKHYLQQDQKANFINQRSDCADLLPAPPSCLLRTLVSSLKRSGLYMNTLLVNPTIYKIGNTAALHNVYYTRCCARITSIPYDGGCGNTEVRNDRAIIDTLNEMNGYNSTMVRVGEDTGLVCCMMDSRGNEKRIKSVHKSAAAWLKKVDLEDDAGPHENSDHDGEGGDGEGEEDQEDEDEYDDDMLIEGLIELPSGIDITTTGEEEEDNDDDNDEEDAIMKDAGGAMVMPMGENGKKKGDIEDLLIMAKLNNTKMTGTTNNRGLEETNMNRKDESDEEEEVDGEDIQNCINQWFPKEIHFFDQSPLCADTNFAGKKKNSKNGQGGNTKELRNQARQRARVSGYNVCNVPGLNKIYAVNSFGKIVRTTTKMAEVVLYQFCPMCGNFTMYYTELWCGDAPMCNQCSATRYESAVYLYCFATDAIFHVRGSRAEDVVAFGRSSDGNAVIYADSNANKRSSISTSSTHAIDGKEMLRQQQQHNRAQQTSKKTNKPQRDPYFTMKLKLLRDQIETQNLYTVFCLSRKQLETSVIVAGVAHNINVTTLAVTRFAIARHVMSAQKTLVQRIRKHRDPSATAVPLYLKPVHPLFVAEEIIANHRQ